MVLICFEFTAFGKKVHVQIEVGVYEGDLILVAHSTLCLTSTLQVCCLPQ